MKPSTNKCNSLISVLSKILNKRAYDKGSYTIVSNDTYNQSKALCNEGIFLSRELFT